MPRYVVLTKFKDKETGLAHEAGTEVELLVKRADQINANLTKNYGVAKALHRIEEEKEGESDKE